MPVAAKDIANRALQAVGGKGNLTALDETEAASSREARVCLANFAAARDETLADADWPFARHRATLAELSEDPPAGWDYLYAYPEECLQPRKLIDPNGVDAQKPAPFEVVLTTTADAQAIATDVQDAVLVYTRRVADPNLWSPWFQTALAYRLAMMIALSLVGKDRADLYRDLARLYSYALARALSGAHAGRKEKDEPDASWIQARG